VAGLRPQLKAQCDEKTFCPRVGGSRRIVVDETRTISFMGEALRAYAIPWVVSNM